MYCADLREACGPLHRANADYSRGWRLPRCELGFYPNIGYRYFMFSRPDGSGDPRGAGSGESWRIPTVTGRFEGCVPHPLRGPPRRRGLVGNDSTGWGTTGSRAFSGVIPGRGIATRSKPTNPLNSSASMKSGTDIGIGVRGHPNDDDGRIGDARRACREGCDTDRGTQSLRQESDPLSDLPGMGHSATLSWNYGLPTEYGCGW